MFSRSTQSSEPLPTMVGPADVSAASFKTLVCPECGHRNGVTARTVQSRAHTIAKLLRWIGLIGLLAFLGYRNYQSATTLSVSSDGQVEMIDEFEFTTLQPGFSVGQLREIADGRADGSQLAKALREYRPWDGRPLPWLKSMLQVRAKVGPPNGICTKAWAFGWPAMWYGKGTWTQYADVVARTGVVPRDWGVTTAVCGGWQLQSPSGRPTADGEMSGLFWGEIWVSVLIWLVASGVFAALLSRVVRRGVCRKTNTNDTRRRRWYVRAVAGVLVGGTIVGFALCHQQRSEDVASEPICDSSFKRPSRGFESLFDNGRETGFMLEDLAVMTDARVFAAEVVRGGGNNDQLLRIGVRRAFATHNRYTQFGWPEKLCTVIHGVDKPSLPGPESRSEAGGLNLSLPLRAGAFTGPRLSWSKPDLARQGVNYWTVTAEGGPAAELVLSIAAAWILSGLVLRIIEYRILLRRHRHDQCLVCGYSLAGLARGSEA